VSSFLHFLTLRIKAEEDNIISRMSSLLAASAPKEMTDTGFWLVGFTAKLLWLNTI
jgi:hypothetical protein